MQQINTFVFGVTVIAAGIGAAYAQPALSRGDLQVQGRFGSFPGGAGVTPVRYTESLSFEKNLGQAAPRVKFLSRLDRCEAALSSTEVVLRFPSRVVRMKLDGARRSPVVTGLQQQPGKVHYLTGNNPKRWRTNIPTYATVRYEDVYPGVDLSFYGTQQQLEYDFIVGAGG